MLGGELHIVRAQAYNNIAQGDGGFIANQLGAAGATMLSVSDSVLQSNEAGRDGGAISTRNSGLYLESCTIGNNKAARGGAFTADFDQ